MRSNYKKLGPYIREVVVKNRELEVKKLLGVSITKKFIPSIANTVGTDMSKYKIVRTNQFAYGPVTSRNGDKISVALLQTDDCIISTSYTVFEIIDHNELLPEYLMMWFRRPEFDRYARYMSHGSVRELFGWEEMCDVELPVPSPDKQREIVKEYQTIVNRIKLNEQLNRKLEETAQAIYKQWFVDFEFPISAEYAAAIGKPELAGKPYKSSGGEMVYNDELDQEIPKGWRVHSLDELGKIKGGKRLPKGESLVTEKTEHPYIKVADLGKFKFTLLNQGFEYLTTKLQDKISRYVVSAGDIVISIVGTIGIVRIIHDSLDNANLTENCAKITDLKQVTADYLYHYFYSVYGKNELEMRVVGGVQGKLPLYNIASFRVICPSPSVSALFAEHIDSMNEYQKAKLIEIISLEDSRRILLAKMTKMAA